MDEELWRDLPVCSVPPVRWPKVNINGGWLQYSFAGERGLMRDKILGALAICLANGVANVVVGDFGLGNGYRNPPYETAAMWNEVVNGDPAIRGRIHNVAFIFEDGCQSTQRLILDDLAKKQRRAGACLDPYLAAALAEEPISDFELFRQYFVPVGFFFFFVDFGRLSSCSFSLSKAVYLAFYMYHANLILCTSTKSQ